MRSIYFALKFFYNHILHKRFDEMLPLVKKKTKLPVVLSRIEINNLIEVTSNHKHKLVLMFLYYAGLRLDEVRNLRWQDINFDRDMLHIRKAKGENERMVFYIQRLKIIF